MNLFPILILAIWPFPAAAPQCPAPGIAPPRAITCVTINNVMPVLSVQIPVRATAVYRGTKKLSSGAWYMERQPAGLAVVVRVNKKDALPEKFRIVHP